MHNSPCTSFCKENWFKKETECTKMFRCTLYFEPSESNYTPVVDDDDDAQYTSATTNDKINNDNQHDVA